MDILLLKAESYENNNEYKDAIRCYFDILKYNQTNPNILNKIGMCFFNLGNYELAIKNFEKILPLLKNPIPDLLNNIGFCYGKLKDYDNSIKYYIQSNKIKKDAINNKTLGDLYFYIKDYNKSIKYYNKASENNNDHTILYNKCFSYLAQKQFKIGLELYENRLFNNYCHQTQMNARVDIPNIDYWDGKSKCNRLLVVYEQGIGDNIQYYRFIIELALKYPDMIIDYFCKDTVRHLFINNFINININIIDNVILSLYDYKLYIMSLPKILNINEIDNLIIPNEINYIKVNEDKLNYWKEKLSTFNKFKVGIVYNGLLSSFIDKDIPLKYFKKLSELNIDIICLHKKENNNINVDFNINWYDIDNDKPFEDTICILKNIDLLITIDTSIVHLAGIMNINTWLLLGYGSDWRWFTSDICPWYKSVELIRMKENKPLYHIMDIVYDKLNNLLK
jgi:tetratricopeptide (TPR) repeat protein